MKAIYVDMSVFCLKWGMGSVVVGHTAEMGIAAETVSASRTRGT